MKTLKTIIQDYGLAPKKSLGQNFLLNPATTDRIAEIPRLNSGEWVLEIGPGPGGLTRSLLAQGLKVLAIEQDERCIAALHELELAYPGMLEIIHGDALKLPTADILKDKTPIPIVANLPYNIGTPLLIKWLQELSLFKSLTLMFQKEVALRITATTDSSHYGRLAVMTQWVCDAEMILDLSPESFTPPPKVTSSVVHIVPRAQPLGPQGLLWASMEAITRAAFGQRRKMLRASLKTLIPNPEELLAAVGIDGTRRAETLTLQEFCMLAFEWQERQDCRAL